MPNNRNRLAPALVLLLSLAALGVILGLAYTALLIYVISTS